MVHQSPEAYWDASMSLVPSRHGIGDPMVLRVEMSRRSESHALWSYTIDSCLCEGGLVVLSCEVMTWSVGSFSEGGSERGWYLV